MLFRSIKDRRLVMVTENRNLGAADHLVETFTWIGTVPDDVTEADDLRDSLLTNVA